MSWIDLHMHSAFSNDGDFTPEELVGKCQEVGIRLMAVADHNSCKAVQSEMAEAKKEVYHAFQRLNWTAVMKMWIYMSWDTVLMLQIHVLPSWKRIWRMRKGPVLRRGFR